MRDVHDGVGEKQARGGAAEGRTTAVAGWGTSATGEGRSGLEEGQLTAGWWPQWGWGLPLDGGHNGAGDIRGMGGEEWARGGAALAG